MEPYVEKNRRKSLVGKLTVSFVVIIFLFLASTLGLSYLSAKKALYRQFDHTLLARAYLSFRWIEQRNEELRVHDRSIMDLSSLGEHSLVNEQTIIEIRDWNGVVVSRIPQSEKPVFDLDMKSLEEFKSWNIDHPSGVPMRAIAHRFQPRLDSEHNTSYPRREAVIILASDRTRVDAAVRQQAYWLAGIGLCIVGLTGFMVPFVIRRSLAPLETLAQRAERIEATVLNERFPSESFPKELLPISDCLNQLLERLERSFGRERNFTSDVAHELLTPVAELRSLAEFALRYPEDNRDESLVQSLEILKRVETIIGTLLDLCRVEQEGALGSMEPLSLLPVVEEVLASHAELADRRRVKWEIDISGSSSMNANPDRLKVILNNLISNASTYADENSVAKIVWGDVEGQKRLSVINRASSLNQDQVGNLFERFWRHDSSRANSGHFGLGLSLSRELAVSMKLNLEANLAKDGQLAVTLCASSK